MTVIAWDGKTLAADKQCTNAGHPMVVTKIHRMPDGILGFIGNGGHASALLQWFQNGCIRENWPNKIGDDTAGVVFITNGGEVRGYSGDDGPHYIIYENKFIAFGAGRDYALAAMHLGKTAREAVELACLLDTSCGMGIDALELA